MSKQNSPASSLESHVGYWLRFVSNHVSHAFKLKVEARGVTVAEWVVLRVLLDAGEINPSQIAQELGMSRGAISKLVDRLITKQLVSCTIDKTDRRYQSIAITSTARKLVPELADLADENDAEFFGHLDNGQRSELIALLRDIVDRQNLRDVPVD